MARITKDTTIGEALQIDAGIIPILMGIGMHCVGCPSSAGETLEEAAMVHGIDPDMLVEEIQNYLQSVGWLSMTDNNKAGAFNCSGSVIIICTEYAWHDFLQYNRSVLKRIRYNYQTGFLSYHILKVCCIPY